MSALLYTGVYWRCVFSSSWQKNPLHFAITSPLRQLPSTLFALIFPDECRLCAAPLPEISRIPVCRTCLCKPAPLTAEHHCVACQTAFLSRHPLDEQGVCALCRRGLTGFDAAYSFGSYEDELRQLIHLFKYGGVQTLARPLGKLLITAFPRGQQFDFIVPMPLHWTKRWKRGFNQSELLAREASRFSNVPLRRLVRRVRNTSVQAGLTGAKRRANVAHAFRAKAAAAGKKILLVDDVMTTGATGGACAAALKKAGAARVTLLTLARVDRRLASAAVRDTDLSSQWSVLGSFENAESRSTT